MKVIIYGKDACPWCDKAKALFDIHNVIYEYRDAGNDKVRNFLIESGFKTVPIVWVGGEFVGGYQELIARQEELGSDFWASLDKREQLYEE